MASTTLTPATAPAPGATPARQHADNASAISSFGDGVHEKGDTVGLTKWQKVKRHFWRFKWWYLLGLVIFLAILLPILFKVIIPVIIRNIVDDQELPVRGGILTAESPSQLRMKLDTMLDTPLGVKIDPMSLKLQMPAADGNDKDHPDAPFLTLELPEQHINGDTEVIIPEQVVTVADQAQLTAWFNDFFEKEEADLRVIARGMTAHLGALKYKVDLQKTIKVQGLNYLKGFGTTSMSFMIPPDKDGNNIRGTLNIPNAGVLTLGLGTLSFHLRSGKVDLGLVTVPNLSLKPGNNSAEFSGRFYFDQLVPNLSEILESQREAIKEGYLEIFATGNNTIAKDGSHIKYLERVLNSKAIPFRVPVISLLMDVVSGFLAGGGEGGGPQGQLLETLGAVVGNTTLLEGMLGHFEQASPMVEGENGNENGTVVERREMGDVVRKAKRSMQMNLIRLGLRSMRSSMR
ncbi:hypothetical protein QBC35DRAFT_535040 [Podospora australis]|uniref:Uncharacterized protein n=1 Tax=Podospora australis TaxID=1536484 RepID=A0AAN7AD98_9PEZI|nr:hypothetical protein QBC35DRAFT_535040 [Podospora australis]